MMPRSTFTAFAATSCSQANTHGFSISRTARRIDIATAAARISILLGNCSLSTSTSTITIVSGATK